MENHKWVNPHKTAITEAKVAEIATNPNNVIVKKLVAEVQEKNNQEIAADHLEASLEGSAIKLRNTI